MNNDNDLNLHLHDQIVRLASLLNISMKATEQCAAHVLLLLMNMYNALFVTSQTSNFLAQMAFVFISYSAVH